MITVTLVVAVLLYTMLIDPQLVKYHQSQLAAQELKMRLMRMRGNLLIKDRVEQAYRAIEPLIQSNGNDQQEISCFTRQLSDLYSSSNLRVRSVRIMPVNEQEYYKILSVRLELNGNVRDVIGFILSFSDVSDPIRIEQFTLQAEQIAGLINATFVISKIVMV